MGTSVMDLSKKFIMLELPEQFEGKGLNEKKGKRD
jgi:hypothetical protein